MSSAETSSPSDSKTGPQKTPLFEAHKKAGARMVDFGGWKMPVQYAGILQEHRATRDAVGLFDVSHMGEFHFLGTGALSFVNRVITNDATTLVDGRALYTLACNDQGGIVDDLIVYRINEDHLMMVVNAANISKDWAWFAAQRQALGADLDCRIEDSSAKTAMLAFQGPKAEQALASLLNDADSARLCALRPFGLATGLSLEGRTVWCARTGYTGEDGFEIFAAAEDATAVWTALLTAAQAHGGGPVGLGARDTLRLEAKLSLYGNELSDQTSPLEAGLGWAVKLNKPSFIGQEALLKQKSQGLTRRLCGLKGSDRPIPRASYPVFASETGGAQPLGHVTSGTVSPTLGARVALAYLPNDKAVPGTEVFVDCRGKMSRMEVVSGPFYRRSTTSKNS